MDEAKKSFDPWRLILIVVCVVGFSGGIYLLNTTINTRLDAVDAAVTGVMNTTSMSLDRIDGKLVAIQASMKEMEQKMAAPIAAPPPPAPADAAAAAPKPKPKPAPAKAE
jgi:ribosomal protein L12E/L44/L45/RPP1/RPP2